MDKKNKFRLVILLPLCVLVTVYFLVPSISYHLVKAKLPTNITLLTWDMGWPSLTQVCIKEAVFDIKLDQHKSELALRNLCIHYFTKNVRVNELLIETVEKPQNIQTQPKPAQQPIEISRLLLPKVDFSDLNHLGQIGSIKIGKIRAQYRSNASELIALSNDIYLSHGLNNPEHSTYRLTELALNQLQIDRNDERLFKGRLAVNVNSESLSLSLDTENNISLVELVFEQTSSQLALDLSFDAKLVNERLNLTTPRINFNYQPTGQIRLELLRELESNKQSLSIDSIFSSTANHTKAKLKIDLMLFEGVDTETTQIKLKTKMTGEKILIETISDDYLQNIQFDSFSNTTNLSLNGSSNKLDSINNIDSVFQFNQLEVKQSNRVEENELLTLSFGQIRASLNNKSNISIASFDGVDQHLLITGKLEGESIFTEFLSRNSKISADSMTVNRPSKLNLDFTLEKQINQYESSGKLHISEFISNSLIQNIDDSVENISSGLEANLKWENLSAKIDPKLTSKQIEILSSDIDLKIDGEQLKSNKIDLASLNLQSTAKIKNNGLNISSQLTVFDRSLALISISNKDIFSIDEENSYSIEINQKGVEKELVSDLATSILEKMDLENEVPLLIKQGNIKHNHTIVIKDDLSLASDLDLQNFDLDINHIFLSGLNYKQRIASIEPFNLSAELNINEITFASGLMFANLSSGINVSSRSDISSRSDMSEKEMQLNKDNTMGEITDIAISNIKADLWNGEMRSKSIQMKDGAIEPTLVELDNIDLTEMLFFLDMKGLYADGNLNIHLPVAQLGEKYIIEGGHFSSTVPGIIKYDSGQEQVDVEANIALHALQDFHYKKLDGTIHYDENGAYEIKLHLLGANPSLYDGYPIDFDLNLNGELSDVFQSVFLTGDFEKSIIERAKIDQLNQ